MKNITLEELLEAGCHFGHQVTRQNPKARDFVFESRDGINIIDLAKTKEGLDEALIFVNNSAKKEGATLLLVGTKRQAQEIVQDAIKSAKDMDVYSVTKRWMGGTLTNFSEMKKNVTRLKDLIHILGSEDDRARYTKKELGLFDKERAKLESFYSGIAEMKKTPDIIFIIDTHLENLAVREANRMAIPIVGIVDTNADPDPIDYCIPANDDAVGSIKLLTDAVIAAWMEGKADGLKAREKAASNAVLEEAKKLSDAAKAPVIASVAGQSQEETPKKEKKETKPKKAAKKKE